MAIPDYQSIMLPLLRFVSDQEEHSNQETIGALATQFSLTDEDRAERLPSGRAAMFDNRVGWAVFYLKKAGLLSPTRRSHFVITKQGLDAVAANPERVDTKFLRQFDAFNEYQARSNGRSTVETTGPEAPEQTPEEILQQAHKVLTDELSEEILGLVMACSPAFFERLVVDLLVAMGYGGSIKEAGQALGKSGDGGIDGIIKEDRLGLDIIYIQAKRWEGPVGRPEIQKFAGALQGRRSRKGVFLTTSSFTKDALEFVSQIDSKIILIDGERLTELMIEHNIGVAPFQTYEIKRADSDYFEEA